MCIMIRYLALVAYMLPYKYTFLNLYYHLVTLGNSNKGTTFKIYVLLF